MDGSVWTLSSGRPSWSPPCCGSDAGRSHRWPTGFVFLEGREAAARYFATLAAGMADGCQRRSAGAHPTVPIGEAAQGCSGSRHRVGPGQAVKAAVVRKVRLSARRPREAGYILQDVMTALPSGRFTYARTASTRNRIARKWPFKPVLILL